jgi:phosphoserine phosphatase RsbU/P
MLGIPILFRRRLGSTPSPVELEPAELPKLNGADIAAAFHGQRMAGDYYDFLQVNPGQVLFALMDLAGRRADNRRVLCAAQTSLRSAGAELFRERDINEADAMIELCVRLNRSILSAAGGVRSCSAFAGCYDEQLGTVCYINAGHTPGLLRDRSGLSLLAATGLPLGLFSHAPCDAKIVALEPGAALLIVSRGIIEASRRGEEFGVERLKETYQRANIGKARELSASIVLSVEQFVGAPPTHNDVTALSLIRAQAAAEHS